MQGDFDYFCVNNPHINFLRCWIVVNGKMIKEFTITGDNLPFESRSIPETNFIFPIKGSN